MEEPSELFAKLDADGEDNVRLKLAQGIWSEPRTVALIKEWLALIDRERSAAASAKRDAREEETLAIAKSANRLASDSNRIALAASRWAMYAAIIAITAIAIATKDQILALIFGNP